MRQVTNSVLKSRVGVFVALKWKMQIWNMAMKKD